jgi:hypothetical protein
MSIASGTCTCLSPSGSGAERAPHAEQPEWERLLCAGKTGVAFSALARAVLPGVQLPAVLERAQLSGATVQLCSGEGDAAPLYAVAGAIASGPWRMRGLLRMQAPGPGVDGALAGTLQMETLRLGDALAVVTGEPGRWAEPAGKVPMGPAFDFDLAAAPLRALPSRALAVQVLGALCPSTVGYLDASSLFFPMEMMVGGVLHTLEVNLTDKNTLSAWLALRFPLRLALLGRPVGGEFHGRATLIVRDAKLGLDIRGSFDGQELPPIHLHEGSPEVSGVLEDVAKRIAASVQAEAAVLYGDRVLGG